LGAAVGCSSDPSTGPDAIDAGIVLPDAESSDAINTSDVAPPASKTYVRLAQMSADVGAVDFCVRSKVEQLGPLVTPNIVDAGTSDASVAGVTFGQLSHYLALNASGTVEVAIVAAPATDCSAPIAVGTVTLDAGKHRTIVLMGVAKSNVPQDRAIGVSAFVDDANGDPSLVRMRVINAALGTAQLPSVGPLAAAIANSSNSVLPLAAEVLPRKASTPSSVDPTVDTLGYHGLTVAPKGPVGLRISYGNDAGINVWTSKTVDLGLTLGSARTVFVVSLPYAYKSPIGAFVCDDVEHAPSSPCVWAPPY
jgi:hypothetical protein